MNVRKFLAAAMVAGAAIGAACGDAAAQLTEAEVKQINSVVPGNAKIKADHAKKVDEAIPKTATAKPAKPRKVLVLTRVTGFPHSSVGLGAYTVVAMGKQTGAYESTVTNDLTALMPENLKAYDAVILCNMTGHWLEPAAGDISKLSAMGKDKKEITASLLKSLMDYVEAGGGLAGFHSSSDANYEHPAFGKLIGGWFDGHPWHEKVAVKLVDPKHPLLAAFEGKDFEITDEIYQFKDPYNRDNLHELLALDPEKPQIKKSKRKDKDAAVAWVRTQGKGRVFYSSLGHREEIYWNKPVMQFYLDGFQWALGDIQADATPDVKADK